MRLMAQYHSARMADQCLLWLLDRIRNQADQIASDIDIKSIAT